MKLDKLVFRQVKKNDLNSILINFKKIFNKKISKDFYNWRYGSNLNSYTSFVATFQNKIIAHIGFVKYRLDKFQNNIYSRHSTFVSNKFQQKGIYSKLLEFCLINLKKKTSFVVAWPNLKNLKASQKHSNFKIINFYYLFNKYYLKKLNNEKIFKKINDSYFKNLSIDQRNHLFFQDISFFSWRYLSYKKDVYHYLDEAKFKNFIFQKKKYKKKIYYLIIDYFGKELSYISHLKTLINFLEVKKINFQILISGKEKEIINFLNKKKINKNKHKFYVGLYNLKKNENLKNKIQKKINNDIKISDTDVFIETC